MGTTAHKVEVAVFVVPVMRPQISDLHEIVAQAERSSFRQIVEAEPVVWGITHLKFQVLFQVDYACTCCQTMDYR